MASSSSFKSYARGSRSQLSEEVFSGGMRWTLAPLPEMQSRMLVNFDIKDMGNMLTPRPGLRAEKIAVFPEVYATAGAKPNTDAGRGIVASKHCGEANGTYEQFIIGNTANKVVDVQTGLIKGTTQVVTVPAAVKTAWSEIPVHEMQGVDMEVSPTWALYRVTTTSGIHKMLRTPGVEAMTIVGAFAFGNQFFNFRRKTGVPVAYELTTTRFNAVTARYEPEVVVPKGISPKEAVLWGYNMLLPAPYTFTNAATAGSMQLMGILPYDLAGALQLSPVINQSLKLVCNYQAAAGSSHRILWETKGAEDTIWTTLRDMPAVNTGSLVEEYVLYTPPTGSAIIRVTVFLAATPTTVVQVMAVGFNFNKASFGSTANVSPVVYTLASCEGMAYWKNQLVVWAPKEDRTVLFVSDVNAPHYFAYPNKAEIFDEPVIHAMQLLDSLLVFTTTSLSLLTMSGDGMSWTKRTIQRNLEISPEEIHLIQGVKNMVFFKSGNYYYMVVPSAKSLGELVIAPVSANILAFFDDFEVNVREIFYNTYGYKGEITLLHYYNFLDFEDIHNVYMFECGGKYLNLDLLYNTLGRTWRAYCFESASQVRPHKQDATTRGTYVALTSVLQPNTIGGVLQVGLYVQPLIQFLQFHPTLVADFYVMANLSNPNATPTLLRSSYLTRNVFKNWQTWDTGYREQGTDLKKRYREIQFKLNNVSQEALDFFSEFQLDGAVRKGAYSYALDHDIDPLSGTYGLLTVVQELIDPSVVPGVTVLDGWTLDESLFPNMTIWKVRLKVSGKGYTPRLLLVSRNEKAFELLNVSWVYRQMYSR